MKTYPSHVICRHVKPSSMFSISNQAKNFCVEASTLGSQGAIYNDACDYGFGIQSDHSGDIAYFTGESPHRDEEGEVQYWTLTPISETLRLFPHLTGWSVTVFND